MNLSLPKILETFPEFNRRVHTPSDFWKTVESKTIDVLERRQKRKGYYVADPSGDFIFIDSRLSNYVWLQVSYHELVHALLHYPSPFFAQKQEFEASSFSLMMICPASELDAGSELRRAAKYCHVLRFILKERERLHFLYQDFGFNKLRSWV